MVAEILERLRQPAVVGRDLAGILGKRAADQVRRLIELSADTQPGPGSRAEMRISELVNIPVAANACCVFKILIR